MFKLEEFTIDDQIRAVEREIGYRKRVYPGWVTRGKMKQQMADYQIRVMEAVRDTLKKGASE